MHVSTSRADGPSITINCPKCDARGVPATTYDLVETLQLFIKHRTTWVVCSNCGSTLLSKVPASELAGLTPEQMEGLVVRRHPPAGTYLAVSALLFCYLPVVGQVLGLLAIRVNRGRPRWRLVSVVALLLGVLILVGVFILVRNSPHR